MSSVSAPAQLVAVPSAEALNTRRARPLRFWLGLLVVACIVPGWVVAGTLIAVSYARERALVVDGNLVTTRTLMQVVDRELTRTEATLEALATASEIAEGDLAGFYARALKVLPSSGAAVILLADPDGNILVDTQKPFGAELPRIGDVAALRRVVATGQPTVSDLFLGAISKRYVVTVEVPIVVDGRVVAVLAGGIPSAQFSAILQAQALPETWNSGIVDQSNTIVARNHIPEKLVGHKASPAFVKAMAESAEGHVESRSREGVDVLTVFSRSPISGWTVAIAVPRSLLNAPLRETLLTSVLAAVIVLLVAVGAAWIIGRRIAGDIGLLVAPARALVAGLPVRMPAVAIAEVLGVATALRTAADLLAQRARDHEKAEAAERHVAATERDMARISALMEAIPDALVVIERDGTISSVNRRGEALFGYDRQELLGQPVENLITGGMLTGHAGQRESVFTAPHLHRIGRCLALDCRRKDGAEIPVDVSLSPFELDGRPCVMAAVRDISERRQLEAEIEANRTQAAASARLAALGTMAGGVAHEINNPLAIIQALAEDLLEEAEQETAAPGLVRHNATRIIKLSDRITRIIRSLRHLSRDGTNDPFVVTALADIIDQALDICAERFSKAEISLTVGPVDPEIRLRCREVQISQIVVNLLQNAFDAAQEQKNDRWIRLSAEITGDRVMLVVTDSGSGVAAHLKERIMEPFFTTKPLGKGTGLGLSLSKQLAEIHGGSLVLTSRDGHTCFILSLPLSGPQQE